MTGKILIGDFLEKFKDIPDESIDCVITSPPYWGLRDYGTGKWEGGDPDCKHEKIEHKTREKRGGFEGSIQSNNVGSFGSERQWTSDICPDCGAEMIDKQMGLELDFNDYLDKLDAMMKECKRVLKPTGTVWVNLGDTYSTLSGGMKDLAQGGDKQYGKVNYTDKGKDKVYGIDQTDMYSNLQSKSRVGIPERFYIRCIDAGWVARNHIPWIKANCMPSSVQDRFTNKWESVFFFAKERKYYFNLDAVREEPLSGYGAKVAKKKRGGIRKGLVNMQQNNLRTYALHEKREKGIPVNNCNPKGKNPGDVFYGKYEDKEEETKYRQGMNKERGNNLIEKRNLPPQKEFVDKLRESFTVDEIVQHGIKRTKVEHWFRYDDNGFAYPDVEDWKKVNTKLFPELLQVYFVTDTINPNERDVFEQKEGLHGLVNDCLLYTSDAADE